MRTAYEAKLRFGVLVLPDNGIIIFNSVKLRVIDNICLCAVRDKLFTELDRFGSNSVDMIKSDSAV